MGFDLDPFDDIFADHATKNSRAGCKFQPKGKGKARPRKESSVPVPSTQSVQPSVHLAGSSSVTSEIVGTENPLRNNDDSSFSGLHSSHDNRSSGLANPTLEHVATRESAAPIVGLVPDSDGDWHSSFGRSAGENADIFFGLESLDDFISQPTTETVNTASRSPPKVDMGAELKTEFSTSYPVTTKAEGCLPPSETPNFDVGDTRNTEEGLGIPVVSSVDDSTFMVSNASPDHKFPEPSMAQDSLNCREAAISNSNGNFHIDNRRLETEAVDAFPCLDSLDIVSELTTSSGICHFTDSVVCFVSISSVFFGKYFVSLSLFEFPIEPILNSGKRGGKFQPKPKVQIDKEKPSTSIRNPDAVESISCPQDAQSVPSGTDCMDGGSISAFSPYDVIDFSSLRFDDSVPTDPTSELPVNREPTNLMDTSQSDAAILGIHLEAVPEIPGKIVSKRAKSRKRKTRTISDRSVEHQTASTSGQENEVNRSSRRLRKQINACKLVDGSEDVANDDDYLPEQHEDDNNDDEYQVENESRKKMAQVKSKKPAAEKEKPIRKRKQSNEVPDQSTKEPPKKFTHSTRRTRRRVDKVLLETPEDEIDVQKLRIRDLILLAEYKERILNKPATSSETPLTNHSAHNSFAQYNEDETFTSEHGEGSNDEQTIPTVQESSTYYNYHSYMEKTPTARWSKQDTELFYEAVRQFGTDLSMIQQLFPDRTRKQVKLKYKKEEHQHPLRLHEALTNPAKDLFHFERVIERLQEVAAQEKQNANRDDSIDLTGEEVDELTPEINVEEVEKSEQIEEEVEDLGPDLSEVHSPVKSCDSEDDLYRWNQYKSEF
ncbi:hypothetical protein F0562_019575 [Nyssa sinensis]|uniref:SANT domain-containing protein n=1 Tax=Nyssa sinensis TaxID=561372 RepID=A0A5J5BTX3_9ASTE|nr:hypothetical protein F0562_019575 [Nyssa sinensis]